MDKPVAVPTQLNYSEPSYRQPTKMAGVVTPTPQSKMAFKTVVSPPDERSPTQQAKEANWERLDVLGDELGPMLDINISVNQMDERPRSNSSSTSIDDVGAQNNEEVRLNCSVAKLVDCILLTLH